MFNLCGIFLRLVEGVEKIIKNYPCYGEYCLNASCVMVPHRVLCVDNVSSFYGLSGLLPLYHKKSLAELCC